MEKNRFDFSRLRGRIVERFGSCGAFAEAMGFLRSGLSSRMNNQTRWRDVEIYAACELLGIPGDEITLYFFTPKFD